MPQKPTAEALKVLNDLVQDGLIEVVRIDATGEPCYQIASRFRNAALGLACQSEVRADRSISRGSSG